MAKPNPSYYQTSPSVRTLVKHQEHIFDLYAFQLYSSTISKHGNEYNIVLQKEGLPNNFGRSNVSDWDVRAAPDPMATVVARLQGLKIVSSKSSKSWYASFIVAFTDDRFKGSTLSVQGLLGSASKGDKGEWAVVGGTGEFACAQGVCYYETIEAKKEDWTASSVIKLHIRAVCLAILKPDPVEKVRPWGGNGGAAYEIPDAELPQRLKSLTIYANDFIQTIAFSYTDQAGRSRTVGPWGGDAGKSKHQTIEFGPLETVKAIYGATGDYGGHTVVTALTIFTNNGKPYGPYGKQNAGHTPFHIAAPSGHNIVGFYGRVGEVVDKIGAYVGPDDY